MASPGNARWQGLLCGTGSAICSALMIFFIYESTGKSSVGDLLFIRAFGFLVVFVPLAGRKLPELFSRKVYPIWIRSFFAAFAISLYIIVGQKAEISQISTIYTATPVIVSIVAWLALGEPISKLQIVGSIVAACGLVAMNFDTSAESIPLVVFLLAVASMLCRSLSFVALRKAAQTIESSLILIALSLGLLAASQCFSVDYRNVFTFWRDMNLVGFLLASFGSHICIIFSYRNLPAGNAALLLHTNVAYATLLGALFHNYIPSVWEWVGLCLIFSGAVLSEMKR